MTEKEWAKVKVGDRICYCGPQYAGYAMKCAKLAEKPLKASTAEDFHNAVYDADPTPEARKLLRRGYSYRGVVKHYTGGESLIYPQDIQYWHRTEKACAKSRPRQQRLPDLNDAEAGFPCRMRVPSQRQHPKRRRK